MVCANCSSHSFELEKNKGEVRICNTCYEVCHKEFGKISSPSDVITIDRGCEHRNSKTDEIGFLQYAAEWLDKEESDDDTSLDMGSSPTIKEYTHATTTMNTLSHTDRAILNKKSDENGKTQVRSLSYIFILHSPLSNLSLTFLATSTSVDT